jgi:hypothetical protein
VTRCTSGERRPITPLRSGLDEQQTGPFHFAKGPLFLLCARLVRELVFAPTFHATIAHLTGLHDAHTGLRLEGSYNTSVTKECPPYEDALVGMMLAKHIAPPAAPADDDAPPAARLVFVHMGLAAFAEPFGAYHTVYGRPRNSTLVWHESQKMVDRLELVHAWAHGGRTQPHRCPAPIDVRLRCSDVVPYTSCTGAVWSRCLVDPPDYARAGCAIAPAEGWLDDACPPPGRVEPPTSGGRRAYERAVLSRGYERHGRGIHKLCGATWRANAQTVTEAAL